MIFKNKRNDPPAPNCPYCGYLFESIPTRKRACPQCKEIIILRGIDGQTQKSLLTVEQNEQIEREIQLNWIGQYFCELAEKVGYNSREMKSHYKKWQIQTGSNRTLIDYYWSTLNQFLTTLPIASFDSRRSWVYLLMAQITEYEGRDSLIYKQEYHCSDVISQSIGNDCYVEIITNDESCPECKNLNGRLFTTSEFIKEKPLPVLSCSHKYGCRCHPIMKMRR